jgi:hypothetical protein
LPSTLVVTNTGDPSPVVSGDGSLRGEILAAASGDTIEFSGRVINGQPITLNATNGPLEITQSLNIEGRTRSASASFKTASGTMATTTRSTPPPATTNGQS